MDRVELYRQVFKAYKDLCAKGEAEVSFCRFCRERGIDSHLMRWTLGREFENIKTLPGYKNISTRCSEVAVLYCLAEQLDKFTSGFPWIKNI